MGSFSFVFAGVAEMPIYAYRCEACGFEKDVLQKRVYGNSAFLQEFPADVVIGS